MILLYHHVAPLDRTPALPQRDESWHFSITPEQLGRHIDTLRGRGYRFCSLTSMVNEIKTTGRLAPRQVAVTLDDGWADNFDHAFPVFQDRKLPATFFVTTGHLRDNRKDPVRMSGPQLRELTKHGMEVGAHTRTHPDLARLNIDQAREEIGGSRQDLEQLLGQSVDLLAYPGGSFNRQVATVAAEAGYRAACSVIGLGINDPDTMYWLYRDTLSGQLNTWRDRLRMSGIGHGLLNGRARKRVSGMLGE